MPLGDSATDHMPAVEMRVRIECDEELTPVGVLARIRHRQESRTQVPVLEILIFELGAENGVAAGPIHLSDVAALTHETGNDSVEYAPLVVKRFSELTDARLARAELSEILGCLGRVRE